MKRLLRQPIFVVGCGHSGTTLVGTVIGRHPAIAYMNEPLRTWELDPRAAIWSRKGGRAKLCLDADDVRALPSALIRGAFWLQVRRQGATRLAEKLPINSFRVGYIDRMFPDAVFVHVLRDPIDAAESITTESSRRSPGATYNWAPVLEVAERSGGTPLLELCHDRFTMALLEWRVFNEAAARSLAGLDPARSIVVRYEDVTRDPLGECERLERFIGGGPSPEMRAFARDTVRPGATAPPERRALPGVAEVVGDLMVRFGYPPPPG